MLRLGEKTFGVADQQGFAVLSGDYNPAHVDVVSARRSSSGKADVHGINLLFHALEFWFGKDPAVPAGLDCAFVYPIGVGDHAVFTEAKRSTDKVRIDVAVRDLVCCKIDIILSGTAPETPRLAFSDDPFERVAPTLPIDWVPSQHVGKHYAVALPSGDAEHAFPITAGRLAGPQIRAVLSTTYFVGMVCPGRHSIFSTLTINFNQSEADVAESLFIVDSFDERFNLFTVSIHGAVHGTLTAFARPKAVVQMPTIKIIPLVRKDEFSQTTALVIGGSRGLGELVGKIIAAGGGRVVVTYSRGAADAQAVKEDIEHAGGIGTCSIEKFDLTENSFSDLDALIGQVTSIYYFATPRITRQKRALFEPGLFGEFVQFYLTKFSELCDYFERHSSGKVKIFLPSSIFVEKRPRGLAEYAMVKAAAETLASEINARYRKVSVVVVRLPQLNTDQNAAVIQPETASNIETLLPVVRSIENPAAKT
jgi:NAD(P)-dependent dehydrogenase (short-subunit alcohol dehydrogenase family)